VSTALEYRVSTPTLLDLPEIVNIEIASWLDLKDAVTFTQVRCALAVRDIAFVACAALDVGSGYVL
jgi:hypothetical protein